MQHFAGLRDELEDYLEASQVADVEHAFVVARDAHQGQFRSSGEPYITHPVAAAYILARMRMDYQTVMAALLHDVIEDCDLSQEDLAADFGTDVAELVEGVSKLTKIKFRTRKEAQAENFRKMLLAMVQDIRVILIKMADRLHNMQTLGFLLPEKKRRIAKETLEIYVPIANRLGIYQLREQLEDLGFQALHPLRYKILEKAVQKARGNRKAVVEEISSSLKERLAESGIAGEIQGREKSLFSIYRKMRDKVGTFNEVMDIYGFRIITEDIDSCYRILGQIHNLYKPVPGRFKDYIAIPKTNGYQSLHTTLKGPHGLHVEVQIRTKTMHQMAQNGVAAHWMYRSGDANPAETRARQWMQNIMEMQRNAGDSLEFIENVKIDLFPDEVYVFTPKGKIIEMPRGATPVDFAYAIHTDIGNNCVAAKIDRQTAPLSTVLVNGQTVEVVTAPGSRPNPAWLSFVVTGKARSNIRHFVKNLRTDEAIALGARLLEKALDGKTIDSISKKQRDAIVQKTMYANFDEILEHIGLGQVASIVIAHRLNPPKNKTAVDEPLLGKPLAIEGTEGLVVSYGQCCRPIPGDPIVAHVSPGKGFIIHRDTCANINQAQRQPDKYMTVQWSDNVQGEFDVELKVEVFNQRGVLAQLTSTISGQEANIVNISIDEKDGESNNITFLMKVKGRKHLAQIIRKLRVMPFVNRVARLT